MDMLEYSLPLRPYNLLSFSTIAYNSIHTIRISGCFSHSIFGSFFFLHRTDNFQLLQWNFAEIHHIDLHLREHCLWCLRALRWLPLDQHSHFPMKQSDLYWLHIWMKSFVIDDIHILSQGWTIASTTTKEIQNDNDNDNDKTALTYCGPHRRSYKGKLRSGFGLNTILAQKLMMRIWML